MKACRSCGRSKEKGHECDLRLIVDVYAEDLKTGQLVFSHREQAPEQRYSSDPDDPWRVVDNWRSTDTRKARWVHADTLKPGGSNYVA